MRRFVCVRHANATGDTLSEVGVRQATALRAQLARTKFDLICHSRASRTLETGKVIAGDSVPTLLVSDFFLREGSSAANTILEATGTLGWDAVPRLYLESVAGAYLLELADDAWNQVWREVERTGAEQVLVIGHGLLLPIFGMLVGAQEDKPLFEGMVLDNCAGFSIPLDAEGCPTGSFEPISA